MAAPAPKSRKRGRNELSQRLVLRQCEESFPHAWFKGEDLPRDRLFRPVETNTDAEAQENRDRQSRNLWKVLNALQDGEFLVKDKRTKLYRLAEANPPPPERKGAPTYLCAPLRRIICVRGLGVRNP